MAFRIGIEALLRKLQREYIRVFFVKSAQVVENRAISKFTPGKERERVRKRLKVKGLDRADR
jgi:hypothetical protein